MSNTLTESALIELFVQRIVDLARTYVAACEPLRALRLIADCPPFLEGHPALAQFRAAIEPRVKHMTSPEAYKAYYGTMGEAETTYGGAFQDRNLLTLPRAAFVLAHAAKPQTRQVMSIGCGDGTLEKEILDRYPHVEKLFVSDLNPTGNLAILALQGLYPGRVEVAPAIGFGDAESCEVDLVYACEVIEHVLDPSDFVLELTKQLRAGGTCLVTTPNPVEWVEFYHNVPAREPTIQHVRGVTAKNLRDWFAEAGFVGLVLEAGGTLLAAQAAAEEPLVRADPVVISDPTDTTSTENVLRGPQALREVYHVTAVRLSDGARVCSANGAVLLPYSWRPQCPAP